MKSVVCTTVEDEYFMLQALAQAQEAAAEGEIPVGAVVVCNGRVIGRGHNCTEAMGDVTAHAEMIAISSAANFLGGKYLSGCTLYVTVEPCPMCAGAIGWAQVSRIVIGAPDTKRGYSTILRSGATPFHPKAIVTHGILAEECTALMKDFFSNKR